MSFKIMFPNAIDMVCHINDNIISNALIRRSSFTQLPSIYDRAYALVHETGYYQLVDNYKAPTEALTAVSPTVTKSKI